MCQTKECVKCKEEKLLTEFSYHLYSKDNLYKKCKLCIYEEKHIEVPPDPLGKTCTICNEFKLADFYRYKKNGKWDLTSQCKTCISERHKQNSLIEKTPDNDKKTCCQCNIEHSISFYTKDSYKKDGLRPECNDCKTKNRAFRREREREMGKLYYKNNRPRQREYAKKRDKYRRANDPFYKLKVSIRGRVKAGFTSMIVKGAFKSKNTEKILGCTFEEFKNHIESQFENWMNWSNHGDCKENIYKCTWDLDHIIPLTFAKTEEELYLLNHWSNFQPLCSKINRFDKKAEVLPCSNLVLKITVNDDYTLSGLI